jgi:hypothetical protein
MGAGRATSVDRGDITDADADPAIDRSGASATRTGPLAAATRLLPWVVVLAVAVIALLRNEVAPGEIVRFAAYWSVALVAPGFVVFRSVAGRSSIEENLIGGAATGLALEIFAWHLLRTIGLDGLVVWWWLPVVVVFALVPALRSRWLKPHAEALPAWWSWSIATVICLAFAGLAVGGFRVNPLPPSGGEVYVDLWWHLAMVQELMRAGPAEVPQVAGQALDYHFNAHAHMAVASEVARVEPEVVLFRLWVLPIVAVTIGLVAAVARRLSGALWAGPVAAWLTVGALSGGFLWPDNLGSLAASPFVYLSPSQLIANVFMAGALWLLVDTVRGRSTRWHLPMIGLFAWAGAGAKPTVGALLLGGVALAMLASLLLRRTFPDRTTIVAGAGLFALLAWSMVGQSSAGSRYTLLGSLRGNRVYEGINPSGALRGLNDGLLLDSIDDVRAVVAVIATLVTIFGFQLVRLVGFGVLVRSRTRNDLAGWLLAGAVVAGWFAFLLLDHVGYSQSYFVHTAVPAGAALTAWLLVDAVHGRSRAEVVPVVAAGVGVGAGSFLIANGAATRAFQLSGVGMLRVVVVPLVVIAVIALVVGFVWRRLRRSGSVAPLGLALSIAITIGLASAPAASAVAGRLVEFGVSPDPVVDPTAVGYVSAGELDAVRWLRDNTAEDAVVATNLHCRPPSNEPVYCDARGYWVSGQSGRRVVLEGWAYTAAAQELHGEGGRSFAFQPAPWGERYELSQAAVTAPTAEVLDRLVTDYGASWLVAVRRANPISPDLAELADLEFDNGEVAIFRLRERSLG